MDDPLLLPSDWIAPVLARRAEETCEVQPVSMGSTNPTRNALLSALDRAEYTQLLRDAEAVELKLRYVLYEANAPIYA